MRRILVTAMAMDDDEKANSEFDVEKVEDFFQEGEKAKRVRISAAEMRQKQGDTHISRAVPEQDRKTDEELLAIGLRAKTEKNKDRCRAAPYVWNEKGFLYEKYFYVIDKRDNQNEYVWNNDLL